ncbi:MAG: hypothetical protein HOI95_23035 [Chromatiales bacterium]|nr:hypothetical protein [Chromatiales bacterium]
MSASKDGGGNRHLEVLLAVTVGISAILMVTWPWGGGPLTRPGSPLLQSAAMLGATALVGAFIAAMGKRFGASGQRGLRVHIVLSAVGFMLVASHSTGSLASPPALMLAALTGLMALGWWARTEGARRMSATFGSKPAMLSGTDDALRAELRALITRKVTLVTTLEPGANEGEFSLQPRHWFSAPFSAWRFSRAAKQERTLLGTRSSVSGAQAYWRGLHQLLAWGFLIGLTIHVVLVTWFASYVAEGRDIYWWHLAAWDLPITLPWDSP